MMHEVSLFLGGFCLVFLLISLLGVGEIRSLVLVVLGGELMRNVSYVLCWDNILSHKVTRVVQST